MPTCGNDKVGARCNQRATFPVTSASQSKFDLLISPGHAIIGQLMRKINKVISCTWTIIPWWHFPLLNLSFWLNDPAKLKNMPRPWLSYGSKGIMIFTCVTAPSFLQATCWISKLRHSLYDSKISLLLTVLCNPCLAPFPNLADRFYLN